MFRDQSTTSVGENVQECKNQLLISHDNLAVFVTVYGAQNRFRGIDSASLCSLAGR
jgi:hypothetical protein